MFSPFASLRRDPRMFLITGLILSGFVLLGTFFYVRSRDTLREQLRDRLTHIAAIAAQQFTGEELAGIADRDDVKEEKYKVIARRLDRIRRAVPGIRYAYIMRKTKNENILSFVADADTVLTSAELDKDGNGTVDADEEPSFPGDDYDATEVPALRVDGFQGPAADEEITIDQWGAVISGYAPIFDKSSKATAVLGLDMSAQDFITLSQSTFSPVLFMLIISAALIFVILIGYHLWRRRLAVLQELEEERSAFMDLTLHQLGAPLTTFRWWVEILKERGDEQKDVYLQLQEGLHRMHSIMDALKEANKARKGEIKYMPEQASLKDIVDHVVQAEKQRLHAHGKELIVSVQGCNEVVRVDRKLIAGVLRELVDNADAYSPPSTSITIHAICDGNEAVVTVTDQGHGIPDKDMEHVFEKFVRGSNAMKYKPVGYGLGLFISKAIIEKAGGKMWVKSKEGKGTMVGFRLPMRKK